MNKYVIFLINYTFIYILFGCYSSFSFSQNRLDSLVKLKMCPYDKLNLLDKYIYNLDIFDTYNKTLKLIDLSRLNNPALDTDTLYTITFKVNNDIIPIKKKSSLIFISNNKRTSAIRKKISFTYLKKFLKKI